MKLKKSTAIRLSATAASLVLSVTACGAGSAAPGGHGGGDNSRTIKFAAIPGYTDTIGTSYIFKHLLEDEGYNAEVVKFTDIPITYLASSKGEVDVIHAFPEFIQKELWDDHEKDLEDLGSWFPNYFFGLAVPDYMTDVKSIEDLPAHAVELKGEVFGIEPGTSYSKHVQDVIFPDYGLGQGFTLKTSSTSAMLAALKKAHDSKEPIVVTSWVPWWANKAFDLRFLEDPKGSFPAPEGSHLAAHKGFSSEFPKVAAMLSAYELTEEQLTDMDDMIANQYAEGQEDAFAKAFLEKYPDVEKSLRDALNS